MNVRQDNILYNYHDNLTSYEIIYLINENNAIKELRKSQIPDEVIRRYQRKFTASVPIKPLYEDKKNDNNNKDKHTDRIDKSVTGVIDEKKLVTPLSNSTTKFPSKFMEIYRKSIGGNNSIPLNKIFEKNESIKNSIEINANNDDSLLVSMNSRNNISKVNTLKDDTIIEGDVDDKNEKEEIENDENDNDSTASEKKCFEDLVICDEKDFNIIPIKQLMPNNKKNKNKKLADNLRSMLSIIQKRRDVLINHQKMNHIKLEKLGYKMKYKY